MNKNLAELANEEKNKYFKEWREKNKEKIKQYNEKYWLKKAQRLVNSEA